MKYFFIDFLFCNKKIYETRANLNKSHRSFQISKNLILFNYKLFLREVIKVTKCRCAFSVKYINPEYPDEVWAADWDWNIKRQWARSFTPGTHIHWYTIEGIDELAYEAILKKFGLTQWKNELPLQVVQRLSPAQLEAIRREKEKIYNLAHLEIISDTLGDPSPAHLFD